MENRHTLEIDINGAAQIKAQMPEALSLFLTAPGNNETERRLRNRVEVGARAGEFRLHGRAQKKLQEAPHSCE